MKTVKRKHLAYVFISMFTKVAMLFAVLVPVLELSSKTPIRSFEYVMTTILIAISLSLFCGLVAVLGIISYTKLERSFEYDGSWKDLKRKWRLF